MNDIILNQQVGKERMVSGGRLVPGMYILKLSKF